jgi:hypothetical protein
MNKESNINNQLPPTKPSSEEQFIRNYFSIRGIKYIPEYNTPKLNGDEKSHRRIDFYLPELGVYVEHFGWYNKSKEHRAEYDKKVTVLIKNEYPVVILYPHELGFLDYAFHVKVLKVLRVPKFKNNYKMFRYKLNRYTSIGKGYFFFLAILVIILTLKLTWNDDEGFNLIFGIGFAASISLLYEFTKQLIRVFFQDE